jgi:hypothetical protein
MLSRITFAAFTLPNSYVYLLSLHGDILETRKFFPHSGDIQGSGDVVEIEIVILIDFVSFGRILFVCPSVIALSLEYSSLDFISVGSISLANILANFSHLDVLWR